MLQFYLGWTGEIMVSSVSLQVYTSYGDIVRPKTAKSLGVWSVPCEISLLPKYLQHNHTIYEKWIRWESQQTRRLGDGLGALGGPAGPSLAVPCPLSCFWHWAGQEDSTLCCPGTVTAHLRHSSPVSSPNLTMKTRPPPESCLRLRHPSVPSEVEYRAARCRVGVCVRACLGWQNQQSPSCYQQGQEGRLPLCSA